MISDYKAVELTRQIKRLYTLINLHIDETLRGHGMARSQFQVMFHIFKNGSMTQKELQNFMQVEPATLSGLTDVLERKGWLERTTHPADKRAKMLKLTVSGQRVLKGIPHPALDLEKQMLHGLKAADKTALKTNLQLMIKNLEDDK